MKVYADERFYASGDQVYFAPDNGSGKVYAINDGDAFLIDALPDDSESIAGCRIPASAMLAAQRAAAIRQD